MGQLVDGRDESARGRAHFLRGAAHEKDIRLVLLQRKHPPRRVV